MQSHNAQSNGQSTHGPARRRVVITGTGAITPIGLNVADTWQAILAGQTGVGPYTLIEKGPHTSGAVAEVKGFKPTDFMDRRVARRRDRYQQFAFVAIQEAMAQSGLTITDEIRGRTGIYIGTGIGGITTLIAEENNRRVNGPRRVSPFAITKIMANGAAGMMAIDYGIWGPANTFATACASGNDAIGHAFRAIRNGDIDIALTGGAETTITNLGLAGFERASATSTRDSKTPRPFDNDRDGLIMGEGSAMMVMETLDHALGRGATILGEIVGYGQSTDAYHITAPSEGGIGAARAMTNALRDANLAPEAVDYISAHGTGTRLNDSHETMSIKHALGEHAYKIPVSSTKSMTGHIMGATGAIESVFSLLAIRDNMVPPTINYATPDPECDLDYVPNVARAVNVDIVLNNAFGFGGHNSVLAFRRYVPDA